MNTPSFTVSPMMLAEYKPEDSLAKVQRKSGEDLSILDMLDRSELSLDETQRGVLKLGNARNYVSLQIEEEEKIGSPITQREFNSDHQNDRLSMDFGDIDSIRHGEQATEDHIIQARHGAMDIED